MESKGNVAKTAKGMPCSRWSRMTEDNKHPHVRINMAKWFAEYLGKTVGDAARERMLKFRDFFVSVKSRIEATERFPMPLRNRYNRQTSAMIDFIGRYDSIAAARASNCL